MSFYYLSPKIHRLARMRKTNCCCLIIVSYYLVVSCFFCIHVSHAVAYDTLTTGQVMRDGEFLESSNKFFRLLFFNTQGSKSRYLGIQYMNFGAFGASEEVQFNIGLPMSKVVWLANRDKPLDSSGNLTITHDGNLVLSDSYGNVVAISTTEQHPPAAAAAAAAAMISNDNTSFATLLDTGNLVLRAGNRILWQSFDHPSDTWLPGMKLGVFRSTTGETQQRFLTSWINLLAPRIGTFTFGVDLNNTKELVAWRRGVVYWRSGMWNGYNFTYFPSAASRLLPGKLSFSYFSNKSQSYFTYNENNKSRHFIDIGSSGEINIFQRDDEYEVWSVMGSSICDPSIPSKEDNHGGCAKKNPEPSTCKEGDTFRRYTNLSMDISYYIGNGSLGIGDCKDICIKSCACKAYASLFPDETGCQFSDGQIYVAGGYNVIYMRDGTLVTGNNGKSNNGTSQGGIQSLTFHLNTEASIVDEDHELPLFTLSSIQIATNFFSDANKIGQGGFGPVYKGQLANGQEIAVKRLSKSSGQGLEEFKNEVILISRLQHRNLVKLLGCCTQGDERILIYEYMPNKSLDSFLFDTRRALLDWKIRVSIIEGIAQGLLYLHKYSRLKIIHRDLKTSNILLDSNMNPKISDFGTARIFGDNESRANTSRIVGTRGYMSPEYALDGLFSVKSDVFSFGVMMLEIISGRKNTGFYQPDRALNLVGYAWDLWKEGRGLEIMDHALLETSSENEVMRYIQVGFLCVQESAADRPTISEVVSMLSNDMIAIPTPKQPSFSAIVCLNHTNIIEIPKSCSINDVTISEVEGR